MKVYVVIWTDMDRTSEIVDGKCFSSERAAWTYANIQRMDRGLNPSQYDWHCYHVEELTFEE